MKKVSANEIPNEQKIFSDAWALLKIGYHAETDEEWQMLTKTAGYFCVPYKDTEFEKLSVDLYKLVLDYIAVKNNSSSLANTSENSHYLELP